MYEIFNQIPTDKSNDKIVTIDYEIGRLKNQMNELHTMKTFESI